MDKSREVVRFSLKPAANVFTRREAVASLLFLGVSAKSAAAPSSPQSVLNKAVQYFNCNNWIAYSALLDDNVSIHDVRSKLNVHNGKEAHDLLMNLMSGGCKFVPQGAPTHVSNTKVTGFALWQDDDGSQVDKLSYTFEVKNGLIAKMKTDTVQVLPLGTTISYPCPVGG